MASAGRKLVAVVTGASRGAGKGIAEALGETGATVYVTGRSRRDEDSPYGGSVRATAEGITRAGGTGVPVVVDHADDAAVGELFARIRSEHGRLDILVNNAALVAAPAPGGFWERPLSAADLLTVGLRSHYAAAWHAAPLLIANERGLIVNTGHYGAVSYHQGPAYGAQKAGADKMAADMARELRPYGVAALSVWMGSLDTERVRAHLETLAPQQRAALPPSESPQFTGRVIAALYACEALMEFSGRAVIGAELGAYLDVTDIDGSRPRSRRHDLGGPPELHHSLRPQAS
ncbi:short-chain dehydrogenase [Streptomyces sulfonofaciens]|uniref:Short-chain dehydrogenase n=1 Tax=Streptomyces sulfonofaciens TaxID=68272 RepID=A0A919L6Y3_9ACTN|nr:SDR family NAD(P)-dependent oxidoreductase [Streptomyces sulfonofaciens]GHH86188.1 short-chain dehydrogenase [Streptomyces sulfonofaciens]